MIIYFNNELQYIDLRLLSSLPLTPDLAWWRVQFVVFFTVDARPGVMTCTVYMGMCVSGEWTVYNFYGW